MAFKSVHRKRNLSYDVASSIRDAILQGEYPEGSAIPPEPELAEQFGVSRAVIRDATRFLEARGLIEIAQGRGMFVTSSAEEALREVLLIALKKNRANSRDVESLIRWILPEVCASISASGDQEKIDEVALLAANYKSLLGNGSEQKKISGAYRKLLDALFTAAGNRAVEILGPALARLSASRSDDDASAAFADTLIDLLRSGDGEATRKRVKELIGNPEQTGLLAQAADLRQEE